MTGNEGMKEKKMDRCTERMVGLEQGLSQDFVHVRRRWGRGQGEGGMKNINTGKRVRY